MILACLLQRDPNQRRIVWELEAWARKMEGKMEALQKKNKDLKKKTSGSEENEYVEIRERGVDGVNVNEVDKNKMYD